jgi:hypothetical protein
MNANHAISELAWRKAARSLRRQVNLAWWLEHLTSPLVICSLLGCIAVILLRRYVPGLPMTWLYAGIGSGLACLALIAWWRARKHFEQPESALVRLEAAMGMNNALTAAHAGVMAWPAFPNKVLSGLSWNHRRILISHLGALSLLLAGLLIPVTPVSKAASKEVEEPLSWKKIESQMEQLTEQQAIDSQYTEDVKKKVEELRSQPEEEWYSHSSLEASDSLQQANQQEMERLAQNLDQISSLLTQMEEQKSSNASSEEQNKTANELNQAMQNLQKGAAKPNSALMQELKKNGALQGAGLSPEQMKQLQQGLKNSSQALKKAGQKSDAWSDQLLSETEKEGETGDGKKPGKDKPGGGAPNRGPGHDPDILGDEVQRPDLGEMKAISSKELSEALPGDVLELQKGEHEKDTAPTQLRTGGGISTSGAGGDRVWKDALSPDEQRAMKKFFE